MAYRGTLNTGDYCIANLFDNSNRYIVEITGQPNPLDDYYTCRVLVDPSGRYKNKTCFGVNVSDNMIIERREGAVNVEEEFPEFLI